MVKISANENQPYLGYINYPHINAYLCAKDIIVETYESESGIVFPIKETQYFLRFEDGEKVIMSTVEGKAGLRGLINIVKHRREDEKEAITLRSIPLLENTRRLNSFESGFAYEILNGSRLRLAA